MGVWHSGTIHHIAQGSSSCYTPMTLDGGGKFPGLEVIAQVLAGAAEPGFDRAQ